MRLKKSVAFRIFVGLFIVGGMGLILWMQGTSIHKKILTDYGFDLHLLKKYCKP